MLLREFWNGRFWPYCTANLRESTCVGYESAWRLHVAPRFGAMQMESISVELVDKWLVGFASSGAARKAWAVLRAILRRAIRWNLLDVDITGQAALRAGDIGHPSAAIAVAGLLRPSA